MCHSDCVQQCADGSCNGHFPAACEVEQAFREALVTDMICPECLKNGRDHKYLLETGGEEFQCEFCKTEMLPGAWMARYAELVQDLMQRKEELESENSVLRVAA